MLRPWWSGIDLSMLRPWLEGVKNRWAQICNCTVFDNKGIKFVSPLEDLEFMLPLVTRVPEGRIMIHKCLCLVRIWLCAKYNDWSIHVKQNHSCHAASCDAIQASSLRHESHNTTQSIKHLLANRSWFSSVRIVSWISQQSSHLVTSSWDNQTA